METNSFEDFQKALAVAWVRAHIGQNGVAWSDGTIHKIGVRVSGIAWPLETSRIHTFEAASGSTWQETIANCIAQCSDFSIPIRNRPIIEPHPNVIPPERRDLTIRRYMSLESFERLITNQAISFGRLDKFPDRLEGSSTPATAKSRIEQYAHTYFKEHFGSPEAYANAISADRERSRRQHFISCWDTNSRENAVMWNAYAPEGVAIESTVERFETSLTKRFEQPIRLGMVNYVDFDTGTIDESNMMNVVYAKSNDYQDERELRAVLWIPPWKEGKPDFDLTKEIPRQPVPVILPNLITKVIVSRPVLETQMGKVQSLCTTAGLPNPVPSSLLREPAY
jgi:hypothetical protein